MLQVPEDLVAFSEEYEEEYKLKGEHMAKIIKGRISFTPKEFKNFLSAIGSCIDYAEVENQERWDLVDSPQAKKEAHEGANEIRRASNLYAKYKSLLWKV